MVQATLKTGRIVCLGEEKGDAEVDLAAQINLLAKTKR